MSSHPLKPLHNSSFCGFGRIHLYVWVCRSPEVVVFCSVHSHNLIVFSCLGSSEMFWFSCSVHSHNPIVFSFLGSSGTYIYLVLVSRDAVGWGWCDYEVSDIPINLESPSSFFHVPPPPTNLFLLFRWSFLTLRKLRFARKLRDTPRSCELPPRIQQQIRP